MKMLLLLSSIYSLLSGPQPDWKELAERYLPLTKTEIIAAIKDEDTWCLGGESSGVLYGLDPKEYTYTSSYERTLAENKYYGYERRPAFGEHMVDDLLPMLYVDVKVDTTTDSVYYEVTNREAYLWHPDGIFVTWDYDKKNPVERAYYSKTRKRVPLYNRHLGATYRTKDKQAMNFVNKFLEEPYVFNIELANDLLRESNLIGVVREDRLVIEDRAGNKYDGIEDLLVKRYGSVDNYVKFVHEVRNGEHPIEIEIDENYLRLLLMDSLDWICL